MSYGIEIKNSNNDLVLDETNEVVLVAEKGTISGIRSSVPLENGNPSIYGDAGGKWWDSGPNFLSTIYLDNAYSEPPIVAVRGANGVYNIASPTSRLFESDPGVSGIDRLFLRSELGASIDYIICVSASEAPASAKALGGDTYGFQVNNASEETIFDSRWAGIVACVDYKEFPTGVDVSISIGSPPGPYTTTVTKTDVDITVPDSTGCFVTTTELDGFISFYHGTTSGQGGEPVENYGGGYFVPSLKPTSSTNILATSLKIGDGPPAIGQTPGTEFNRSNYRGSFLILRYLGF